MFVYLRKVFTFILVTVKYGFNVFTHTTCTITYFNWYYIYIKFKFLLYLTFILPCNDFMP